MNAFGFKDKTGFQNAFHNFSLAPGFFYLHLSAIKWTNNSLIKAETSARVKSMKLIWIHNPFDCVYVSRLSE